MIDSERGRVLRAESRPILDWDRLTISQRTALDAVTGLLHAALTDIADFEDTEKSAAGRLGMQVSHRPLWLRSTRSARTIFVSGPRGTGKTTLLLSLVEATVSGSLASSYIDQFGDPSRDSDPTYDADPLLLRVRRRLTALAGRIVWLEPLDMEPAPGGLSLLNAILARIEAALHDYAGFGTEADGFAAFEEPGAKGGQALADLQQFRAHVTRAWRSNLNDRASALDSDAFIAEVARTERARLQVNPWLTQVLDGIAAHAFDTRKVHDPLFVLPIDDLDLHPSRCLEVLRLLRMIWVPRLLFVVLGDIRITETVVRLHFEQDLSSVGGGGRGVFALQTDRGLDLQGREMGAESLRKLVPAGHRVHMRPLELEEALQYKPVPSEKETLEDLLAGTALGGQALLAMHDVIGAELKSVKDLLIGSRIPVRGDQSVAEVRYKGAEALCSSVRRIADLWSILKGAGEEPDSRRTAIIDYLSAVAVRDVESCVRASPRVYDSRESVLEIAADLHAHGFPSSRGTVELPVHSLGSQLEGSAMVAEEPDWAIDYQDNRLSDQATSTIVAVHDIQAVGQPRQVQFLLDESTRSGFFSGWAETVWREWGHTYRIQWPAPPVTTFWELDQFRQAWRESIVAQPRNIEALVHAWISLSCCIADWQVMLIPDQSDSTRSWEQLLERLDSIWRGIVDARSLRTESPGGSATAAWDPPHGRLHPARIARHAELHRWWLETIAFLSPEAGISSAFLTADPRRLGSSLNESLGELRRLRTERLRDMYRSGLRQTALRLGPNKFNFLPLLSVEPHEIAPPREDDVAPG